MPQNATSGAHSITTVIDDFYISLTKEIDVACLPPTNLTAAAVSDSEIDLSWTASAGATGYAAERSLDDSAGWSQIGTAASAAYQDTGLAVGTTYYYRVRATVASTTSAQSNVANATTTNSSIQLTSLTLGQSVLQVGNTGVGAVTVNVAPANDINVSLSSSDPSVVVPPSVTIAAGQTSASFNITSDAVDQTQATISASYGGTTLQALLDVSPAIDLTAVATSSSKITLYWTGLSGAVGYNIYRSLTGTGNFVKLNSTPYNGADTDEGVTNMFIYNDLGLNAGTAYYYYVAAVNSGNVEGLESNTDSATPDANAIAWDTGDPSTIVSQVQTMVADNLGGDETAVGELTIAGPDGVIYQSFQDGSPAQAFTSSAHYDANSHTIDYVDGNQVPAPIDTTESDPASEEDMIAQLHANFNMMPMAAPKFTQKLNLAYSPTKRPTGIFREVQTQPGYTGLMSYVGLTDPMASGQSNIDGRKYTRDTNPTDPNSSIFETSDTGYVYTGGTAYTTVPNRNGGSSKTYTSDIDAGLMMFRSQDSTHPGWIPTLNENGSHAFSKGVVGYPLEDDQQAINAGVSSVPQVFVTGEPLMTFKAPGYGTIPDGIIVLGFHALSDGQVFHLTPDGSHVQVNDITFVKSGIRGWNRSSSIVLKRMNSIAQAFKINSSPPYGYLHAPDAPGGGFKKTGSFINASMSWGDHSSDDYAVIDGVTLYPGGQWTDSLTWQEGSYPGPNIPSPGSAYVKKLIQNEFFWEQYIYLQTNPYP